MHNEYKHSDWINSITKTKSYLLDEVEEGDADKALKTYHPYLINRDVAKTLLNLFIVNELNTKLRYLDKKMQYDYLFYAVPKTTSNASKKSWNKSVYKKSNVNHTHHNAIKEFYECSNAQAKSALLTLTPQQIHKIVYFVQHKKGGKG